MNPRFVVTNLEAEPAVSIQLYCARGEAENRIKEAQLDLFGTRASCHGFEANQFRLLLAALAYTLMHRLRRIALVGTELGRGVWRQLSWPTGQDNCRRLPRPARSACACSRSARRSCATRTASA